ncbi:hypothetical protein KSS87_021210 [Heliosperma pusillum]|nr:hypothetical protein KSS87_021210 [Heliosperma pusillum]
MQGLTASSSSSSSSLPPKLKVDVIVIKKLIEELERGQKSADMMRNIILEYYSAVKLEGFHNNINNNTHNNNNNDNNNEDYLNALLDHHSKVALDTYATSLSILKSCHFDGNKDLHSSGDSLRRDCNKRRKNVESKEKEVTHLTDDGYIWRKYGQKQIITHHHPSLQELFIVHTIIHQQFAIVLCKVVSHFRWVSCHSFAFSLYSYFGEGGQEHGTEDGMVPEARRGRSMGGNWGGKNWVICFV